MISGENGQSYNTSYLCYSIHNSEERLKAFMALIRMLYNYQSPNITQVDIKSWPTYQKCTTCISKQTQN